MQEKLYTALPGLFFTVFLFVSTLSVGQTWAFRAGFGETAAGSERGAAVCVDNAGNVYMTGSYSGDIDFGCGALPTAPGTDGYVVKFNSAGVCQWTLRFGGTVTAVDQGLGICTNGTSVFVSGSFNTSMTVGTSPTVYTAVGAVDGLVMKLNAATGAVNWVTTFGGSSSDNGQAICVDGSGNPYVSGNFFTSATFGSFTRNVNGGGTTSDLFAAKLDGATGAFTWVSSGGATGANDNISGSGITYVAALNEVLLTGGYNAAQATYATTSPVSSVVLNNAGLNDICLLEVNAADGAFISGVGIGGAGNEEGLGITYDAFTQQVAFTGFFSSTSLTFGANTPITNGAGNDDAFYALYNPSDNSFTWSKAAGSTAGADRAVAIASNSNGGLLIAGRFRGTLSLPTTLASPVSITNARTNGDDIFLARINAADGNGQLLGHGAGDNSSTISNQGNGVAAGSNGNAWLVGNYGSNITFAPLAVLTHTSSTTADIVIARYNDPLPLTATQSQTPVTCDVGCDGTATVTPSGGVTPYTYAWTPNVSTTSTATGLCEGPASVTITDAIGNSIVKNFTISLPVTPQLPNSNTTNTTFVVSASNNTIYDASCNLITSLVPNGGAPVSGTVAARVWIEAGVPTYNNRPYVARHYEIMPASGAATATGRVTLYFTQAEFNDFNAAPGSTLKLPTGPADAAGKANVRFTKLAGASSNGTGLPGTYPGPGELIDPVDSDIVWNATLSRWEISFNVTGFSGFFLQTFQAVLPVTWLSVNGVLNAQQQPVITWKVEERQVASYTIEKSMSGQPFAPMASLLSKGDGENSYSYQETQSLTGNAAYRIKQTDLNGRSTYSRTLLLKSDRKGWVILYPNPVKKTATLNVTDKELFNTPACLYDGTGRELLRIQITQSITSIPMQPYSTGVYTLKLKNGQAIRIVKE